MDLQKFFNSKMDRRKLINNIAMMGAGATIAACTPEMRAQPPEEPEISAATVLNFALNLEYLEAAFYLAVVGRLDELPGGDAEIMLPEGVNGNMDNPANFGDTVAAYAKELAAEELAHVMFLRTALQNAGAPVAERPVLDLSTSFVAAAQAAFDLAGITNPPFAAADFNPFTNEAFFLHGAFIFEDVGVTAYKGAAPLLCNPESSMFLEPAAGILASEAYHAGNIRTVLYERATAGAYNGLPIFAIVNAISDARDALGNPNTDKDQPINGEMVDGDIPTAAEANIAVTDANGVAFSRTPAQVAAIVYLNAEAQPGGFFPNGITVPAALEAEFGALLEL